MEANEYLEDIKSRLIASSAIAAFTIVEELDFGDRGYFRARVTLSNDDFLEIAEYFKITENVINTSETAIAITFLVMNLEALLKQLAFLFFAWFMLCRQYFILQFGKVVFIFSAISYRFRRFPVLPVPWSPFSTCLLPAT